MYNMSSVSRSLTDVLPKHHHIVEDIERQCGSQALSFSQQQYKKAPGNIDVTLALALILFAHNDNQESLMVFRALLLQNLAGASGLTKADVYYYFGVLANRSGDHTKAVQMLERAVGEDASHLEAGEYLRLLLQILRELCRQWLPLWYFSICRQKQT